MRNKHRPDEVLSVRIPKSLAAKLEKHERLTDVPTSRFVRRVLTAALNPFEADCEKPDAYDIAEAERIAREPIEPFNATDAELKAEKP